LLIVRVEGAMFLYCHTTYGCSSCLFDKTGPLIDSMLILSRFRVNVVFYAALGEDHHSRHGNPPNRLAVVCAWEAVRRWEVWQARVLRFRHPNRPGMIHSRSVRRHRPSRCPLSSGRMIRRQPSEHVTLLLDRTGWSIAIAPLVKNR